LRTVGRAKCDDLSALFSAILPTLSGDAGPRGICGALARREGRGRTPAAAMPNVGPVKPNLLRRAGEQRQLGVIFTLFPRTKIVVGCYPGAYAWRSTPGFRVQTSTIFEEQCR
jgi:hypothetical protein